MIAQSRQSSSSVAAFFDLDGTLLPAPSLERRFLAYLSAHAQLRPRQIARWFTRCAALCLGDLNAATEGNKMHLAGLRESLVSNWETSLPPGSLAPFARGLQRLRWHLAQQHQVFFVSGTLAPLANAVSRNITALLEGASLLESPVRIEVCANQLEVRDGRWTGELAGKHQSGEAKAHAIRALAASRTLDLSRSFAYGNGIADLPMLAAVGFPVAVNPSTRLERAARVHGWRVQDWRTISAPRKFISRLNVTPQLSPRGAR